MKRYAIILAAGKGSRMKSNLMDKSKVSYEILGVPLVKYVLTALKPLSIDKIVTIVGFGGETAKAIVENESSVVWQKEQKGTGHAIMQTRPELEGEVGETIILCGDTPLLTSETLNKLMLEHEQNNNMLTVLGAKVPNPFGYGRLSINDKGELEKIIEQKECSDKESKIDVVNTGVYVFDNALLFKYLNELKPNNKAGEYYLTDLIEIFKKNNHKVGVSIMYGDEEMLGINDRVQLAYATKLMRERINKKLMLSGVSIEDPDTAYIGPNVNISPDTIIKPNTTILGDSVFGERNTIGPNTYLENMIIGNDNDITMSHLVDSVIGNNNHIGPFARMRGNAIIDNNTKVGNFVEIKKSHLNNGVKASHLSYIGDSDIGECTNIGCGTITANYDGYNKFKTTIGKNVFVGSGSTLIAPLNVDDDSFIAAGSTITKDVANNDLAIARTRQENKPGYAKIIKNRAKSIKDMKK